MKTTVLIIVSTAFLVLCIYTLYNYAISYVFAGL